MTPDRFQEVERLYHAARARPNDQRASFLAEACASDAALQAEVESMLASERAAAGFMSTPAVDSGMLSSATSFVGRQLGPYVIQSPLGVGGMGEVYRARDSRLGRDVAIKILPRIFTSDPDRLARFEREARLLASLNHPNIGAIYGLEDVDGIPALVLELVEGDTLAERLVPGGPASGSPKRRDPRPAGLPLGEALTIARQIADALEAAHEKGIVHRDLKPANIKITPTGTVKVLDFGLAKFGAGRAGGAGGAGAHDFTNSPTMMSGTREGVILGTVAYMSPEQAQGKAADARSDIWAFGVVLYEMLTGKSGFGGDTAVEVLSNVLKADPDWTALPASAAPSVRSLLRRCLQKDPRQRLRDIADARFQIEEALNEPATPLAVAERASVPQRRERLAMSVVSALALLTLIALVTTLANRNSAPSAAEMRLEITTPPTTDPVSFAISPDGRTIVFGATSEGRTRLWLRSLDSVSARPLAGTDGGIYPFWSPDSRSIGFFADGKLERIDLDGTLVRALANAPNPVGGSWNREGTILFVPNFTGPIFRTSATGGEALAVTRIEARQSSHRFPHFLPDGLRFLYYALSSTEAPGVYAGQLDGRAAQRLLDADAPAVYASSRHLLFVRKRALFAQEFDPVRLALTGTPYSIAEQIAVGGESNAVGLSTSASGPLVYRAGPASARRQFVWFDRTGKEIGTVGEPDSAGPSNLSTSPDGHRMALNRTVNGNQDIWLLELGRGVLSRFTFDTPFDAAPVWSPDGSRIVFTSDRKGVYDLYQKPVTGAGSENLLLATSQNKAPVDWSPDGRFILYRSPGPATGFDLWAVPVDGEPKPFPVVQTDFEERDGQFSPDGKWIAYQTNESGRVEIVVQPFRGPGSKLQVSTNGGAQVRWRPDGKELFYIALDGRLMAVPIRFVSEGTSVEAGAPIPLFATRVGGAVRPTDMQQYVVSSDGQRFLMNTIIEEPSAAITVILNFKPKS
jgi:serine/threonine protein kinase/dipeptidyl aminopeptidase/acylaminoacyl peptidase